MDWNNDGRKDLLTGEREGYVRIYLNAGTDANPTFSGYSYLRLGGMAFDCGYTSTPEIVDWNNDGKKDVLCGEDGGRIYLLINTGSDASPAFASYSFIQNGAGDLNVGSRAAPVVVDWNRDGKKDLLVGETYGTVYYFENKGTDASPSFSGSERLYAGGTLLDVYYYSRFDAADWDNDGLTDLIVGCYEGTSFGRVWYFHAVVPSLRIKNAAGATVASVDADGNLVLAGALTESSTPVGTAGSDLLVKDIQGDIVAALDSSGNLVLAGTVHEHQSSLTPPAGSFVIKNGAGDVVAYFSADGDLYLIGGVATGP